jgi:hypothetical protein
MKMRNPTTICILHNVSKNPRTSSHRLAGIIHSSASVLQVFTGVGFYVIITYGFKNGSWFASRVEGRSWSCGMGDAGELFIHPGLRRWLVQQYYIPFCCTQLHQYPNLLPPKVVTLCTGYLLVAFRLSPANS